MQRGYHLGALTDRCGDPLDRFRAHVADGEDAGACRFQCMASGAGLGSGENEALCVESDARSAEPAGIGLCTNKQKQMADRSPSFLASDTESPANRLQHTVIAFKAADRGARHHFDIGEAADAVDQITRHRLREIATAHQHPDFDALAR